MIQIIFTYVYLLIWCKDCEDFDPVEIIISTKGYLFKNKETMKYGMLFFMLIFSDKYNKWAYSFKKLFICSEEGVKSLIIKLNESDTQEQLMRNMYLVCLIWLETSKELKVKVISDIEILNLFDKIKISDLKIIDQKSLISYMIEMWCVSNEMLYFPIQDHVILQEMFDSEQMRYIKTTIDLVYINLSEFLPSEIEDDIMYTENDFLSASQANFCAYLEEEEESVKESFTFIESDFMNWLFIVLFQVDKRLQIEFLQSIIPLIEQRNECKRILSKIEILEFFLKIYQYHRDNLQYRENFEEHETETEFLKLMLKLISFWLESGIPMEDDMYLYSLIKHGRNSSIDEQLLLMLCSQVEYLDIPNSINFAETQDSFGLAAFISKGKALQKVEREICLSPTITNLPNRKKGYCVNFWFRLKKLYDNMNLISVIDFKGNKILKISLSVVREFENIPIQDRIGISNYQSTNPEFAKASINKYLEFKYIKDEIFIHENKEFPFEFESNKVYNLHYS